MFFRKPSPTHPLDSLPSCITTTKSESFSKVKGQKDPHIICYTTFSSSSIITNNKLRFTLCFSFLFIASCFLVLRLWFPPTTITITTTQEKPHTKTCIGSAPFYIYNLPPQFNLGLLEHCQNLNIYTNMCPHVANNGLGQPLSTTATTTSSSSSSWFATHQFIAEMIIHARLENHACRTWDPSKALLFYVPFYGGLYASSVFREPNHTRRDSLSVDLVDFLQSQPWWNRHNGKDHFLALGRTAWDFMRTQDGPDFGANILLNLPPVQNMSVLTVERQPWNGKNQFGIPYPSYFHPTTPTELLTWQSRMRESERPFLFSFVGGKRKGLQKAMIRDEIVRQCEDSERCELVRCGGSGASRCHDPTVVIDVMRKSRFCLQAPGDSFTRRSTFDSVLAGCVPVFFSEHTAYTQYAWYLPGERDEYSVFIDENGEKKKKKKKIEEVLMGISSEEEERMREVVIGLIPKVTYVHPNASEDGGGFGFRDAVDVALERLSLLVQDKIRDDLGELPGSD